MLVSIGYTWCLLIISAFNVPLDNTLIVLFVGSRLPVIQALAAEVRHTTQAMLSQLLQKLRSNIQVLLRR